MILALLTFISAISISVIAAGYSIIGLAAIFAGAFYPIIAMGGALEIGKLVAASWLYNNWQSAIVPKALKIYLFSAIVILVFITSMGIFGFLSKAHLDQVQTTKPNTIQIELLEKQISQQRTKIDRAEKTLNQLDKALDVYIEKEFVSRGLKEREKQREERSQLNNEILEASNQISTLTSKKSELELTQSKIEAEVGPLKYIAELIYGDQAKDHFDEAVRLVIIILIFVFDPLAVLLLVAANISLKEIRMKKNDAEKVNIESLQDETEKNRSKLRDLRVREKKLKNIVKKISDNNLTESDYEELKSLGLNSDEIKIKLNQIMEWNDKGNT